MGLLKPTNGKIIIDGLDIYEASFSERLDSWRSKIAHVPQNIYLADCSIAENIAFGVPQNHIDLERVKDCAEQAQIRQFIEDSPEGYSSFVGERGIRLSGGQRQRIAIARALYQRASVLFFDEATSALDSETEQSIVRAIDGLSKKLTIFIVAHRLSTLLHCDRVIRLENGNVIDVGPPKSILMD